MKHKSLVSKTAFILLTIITVLLCPLTSVRFIPLNNASADSERQIEFTPEITPLSLTKTAESLEIGPLLAATPGPNPTLGPGQYFEDDDPNRPRFDPDNMTGDYRFGFAQLIENPNLYAVWMTDSEGTHYLIVPHDSEVLTGGTDPTGGFFILVDRREKLHNDIQTANEEKRSHSSTANGFRIGTGFGAVGWAACAIFTGGWCVPVIGIAVALFGLSENKDNDAEIQQNQIDGYRRELDYIEGRMRGKFKIGQVLYDER